MADRKPLPSGSPGGIATTLRRFEEAFNAGDPRRAAQEAYADDARILPPGAPMIVGRENIAEFWHTAAQQLRIQRVKLETAELSVHGDWAHEIGQATLSLAGGQEVACKYVVIWKGVDGSWKFAIDIWNMDV